jgi:hypothetical protein
MSTDFAIRAHQTSNLLQPLPDTGLARRGITKSTLEV